MELMNARGTRDIFPEEKIALNALTEELRKLFELYGFVPLDTPVLERFEILSAKYAGGEEILKETFKLKDQGNRELGLRYDLTVPLARFVGMNSQLRMPFKRYQIDKVWRDGPVESSRFREFIQCDVDIIGSNSMLADAECIVIASDFFSKNFKQFEIQVNNRKLLNELIAFVGIPAEKSLTALLSIDKLKKVGEKEVIKELKEKQISEKSINQLMKILSITGSNEKILTEIKKLLPKSMGAKELEELIAYTNSFNAKNVQITLPMVRGLAYYTGTVIEVFVKGNKSSLCGGGRYDDMISSFLEKKEKTPAVGLSFGLSRIYEELKKDSIQRKTNTVLYIIPISVEQQAIELIQQIRKLGINAEMDLLQRGISKNLDYANKQAIPFVLVLGENELKTNSVKIKNMQSGKETSLKLNELQKLKELIKE
ncbi:MAG: histidine--tRNA ligase [archaeon]|nr:histidine--tRNA ligase [archaeon]